MVVKACTFDVFGTCVDWRTSVVSMLEDEFRKKGHDDRIGDCPKIAQDWRSGYSRYNASVFSGEVPKENVKTIDIVHREILDDLALKYSFRQFFQPQELDDMNLIWHKLILWPDTPIGIIALKRKCIVSTLSNGNMRLLVDQAKFAGMEWDILLSSELYRSAKPHQDVYLGAAKMLDLRPEEICMVAAHLKDLEGAKKCGFQTAFISRPDEEDRTTDPKKEKYVDFVIQTIEELADKI